MNPPAQTGAPPSAKRPKKGNGVTSPSRRGGSGRVITDVLVEMDFVSRGEVDEAIERANGNGSSVERLLVAEGMITDNQLARAVAEQQPLGRRAVAVGALDRFVHLAARDEVHLDQHVREHAAGTASPRRRADAIALLGPFGGGWCPGLCWRIHVLAMAPTASRIACRGAVWPVQRSNDAAPWATRISRPSITSAPRVLAASRSRVPPSR